MIVQALQEVHDRHGFLPQAELRALAARLRVPLHRLHEVASFFPHFALTPRPPVQVRVCRDVACHLRGAGELQARLRATNAGDSRVAVEPVSCLGQCDRAPAVAVGDSSCVGAGADAAQRHILNTLSGSHSEGAADRSSPRPAWRLDPYGGDVRFDAVRRALAPGGAEALLKELEAARLTGLGGAGFPTFRKWSAVRAATAPEKFVVCNADESEPGTFKDREVLALFPHLVIEGMVLAGLVTGATRGIIFIRHEYRDERYALEGAVRQARAAGLLGPGVLGSPYTFDIEVFTSPGGYICGEETALLEVLEDRRAEPRNKPPFPVESGLFGKPTVINNVETLAWVPAIALHGGAWYRDHGVNGGAGLRLVSVSGDVARPGVYEVPFGLTVGEVLSLAGGMADGRGLKAVCPSGPSSGFLPARIPAASLPPGFIKLGPRLADGVLSIQDLPLDAGPLRALGSMLGAALLVIGQGRCLVDLALNLTEFFRNESCGKCVPCRVGSQRLTEMLDGQRRGRPQPATAAAEIAEAMELTSICGLGQVAPNPYRTLVRYFPEELAAHVERGECPAGVCRFETS